MPNEQKKGNLSVMGGFPGQKGQGRSFFRRPVVKAKDRKETLKRLWKYLKHQRIGLLMVLLLVIGSSLLNLAGPYLLGIAIDKYILKGNMRGLLRLIWALIGIYVLSSFVTWIQNYMMVGVSQKTVRDLRKDLFEHLQSLPLSFFDERTHGELMSRLTNDVESISNTLSQGVTQFFNSVLSVFGVTVVMFLLNWPLALVSVLSIPMVIMFIKYIAKFTRRHFGEQQKHLGLVNGFVEENISGQKVIKAYCREEEVIHKFMKKNNKLRDSSIKAQIFSGLMGPCMNLMNNIRFAIVVAFGSFLTLGGFATVGIIASFVNYSKQFGRPLNQIAQLYNAIQSAIAGAERVFEIMDENSEFKDDKKGSLEHVEGEVIFDHVYFGYKKEVPVLKGVSFTATPGQTVALVGPTGAGKTTIINLLTRFYDIQGGTILIDGKDIRSFEKESLRRRLAIVLQDTYLFSGTVRENIRFGRLDASDEEVEQAAKLANAHPFIKGLAKGYDTVLSEEGNSISQGQRQLLSISRAILAERDILILDEATSNVDTRTEVQIQRALLNLMRGKTSFVIAHRLSTIRHADVILVIDQGIIIERGSHDELVEKKGCYYNLYMSQFKEGVKF